jgi:hypothetical protein
LRRQPFQRASHVFTAELEQHEVLDSRFECRLGGRRDRLAANCATAQRVDQAIACGSVQATR